MPARRVAFAFAFASASACAQQQPARLPLHSTFWVDPDNYAIPKQPAEYFSPFAWDAADQSVFRPLTRIFAVDPGGEATNVNAFDEVPDSSWFTNRLGRYALSPDQVADSACSTPPLSTTETWTVAGAKPNGANPGFMIKGPDGKHYMVKFDGTVQGPRATAADVIVSRLFHAVGYSVPCNRIAMFDKSILAIDPEATAEDDGEEVPLTQAHIDEVLSKGIRLPDGRYRASVSLFVEGKPIGPWKYQGTRRDDPNDVIAHEDRRDLRGMRVLAAWVNHFDAREQNTLATFVATGGSGFVRHNVIDFGDCLGSIWEPPLLGRRIGHSNYFDVNHIAQDFATIGLLSRPWDSQRFGPSGTVFGYFGVEYFVPDAWKPGYPNPAFGRMTERDGAWMARILARLGEAELRATVRRGALSPSLEGELVRILEGRRQRILERYLTRVSPLSFPELVAPKIVCLRDLASSSGLANARGATYAADAMVEGATWAGLSTRRFREGLCLSLPQWSVPARRRRVILDVRRHAAGEPTTTARVHLYQVSTGDLRIVGLERID